MTNWTTVASDPITRDGITQALAVIITTIVAVAASVFGAKRGAEATRLATELSIQSELSLARESQEQQRQDRNRGLFAALAAELDLNAEVARSPVVGWLLAELDRSALTACLPILSSLPEDIQLLIQECWIYTVKFNALSAAVRHANAQASPGIRNEAVALSKDAPELLHKTSQSIWQFLFDAETKQ